MCSIPRAERLEEDRRRGVAKPPRYVRMTVLLHILGYLWATPTTLASLILFLLPMWALRQIRPARWRAGAWEWLVVPRSRFCRSYSVHAGWSGTTLGWCIFFSPSADQNASIAVHERRHVAQNLVLGPLFMPLYVVLWFAFGYRANPLEVDARAAERMRALPADAKQPGARRHD